MIRRFGFGVDQVKKVSTTFVLTPIIGDDEYFLYSLGVFLGRILILAMLVFSSQTAALSHYHSNEGRSEIRKNHPYLQYYRRQKERPSE